MSPPFRWLANGKLAHSREAFKFPLLTPTYGNPSALTSSLLPISCYLLLEKDIRPASARFRRRESRGGARKVATHRLFVTVPGTAGDFHSCPAEMEVLARIRAGCREIECDLATTSRGPRPALSRLPGSRVLPAGAPSRSPDRDPSNVGWTSRPRPPAAEWPYSNLIPTSSSPSPSEASAEDSTPRTSCILCAATRFSFPANINPHARTPPSASRTKRDPECDSVGVPADTSINRNPTKDADSPPP